MQIAVALADWTDYPAVNSYHPWAQPMTYDTILDAETWAFVAETQRHYPPDAVARSVAEQRGVYNDLCRAFFQGYPPGVTSEDVSIGDIPTRRYAGVGATVVYLHGGGFVVGGLESHDDVCAEICAKTGFTVVSVDYRLAPEHAHPAMYQDAMAATQAVLAEGAPVVLVGDSAGGNLAAAVAHGLRSHGQQVQGQVLIYPGLGGDMGTGSYQIHKDAPLLTLADIQFYERIRTDGALPPREDPSYAPLRDTDFTGLPPTAIFTAQCDPLSDDGRAYAQEIRAAGGHAEWTDEAGLVHGYLRARTTVTRARHSFDRILAAIARFGAL